MQPPAPSLVRLARLQACNYTGCMTETRWWRYLQDLISGQTQQEAADKVGISKSNFTRWKQGARADPGFVVKIARAYNVNVLEALVEAEFLTEDEVGHAASNGLAERGVNKTLSNLGQIGADYGQAASELAKTFNSQAYRDALASTRNLTVNLQPLVDLQRKIEDQWAQTAKNAASIGEVAAKAAEALEAYKPLLEALTEEEKELFNAGKAPELKDLADLKRWRNTHSNVVDIDDGAGEALGDDLARRRMAREAAEESAPVFDPARHVAMSHDQDAERFGDDGPQAPEFP